MTHHEKPTTRTSPLPVCGQVAAPVAASSTTGSSTSWHDEGCSTVGPLKFTIAVGACRDGQRLSTPWLVGPVLLPVLVLTTWLIVSGQVVTVPPWIWAV